MRSNGNQAIHWAEIATGDKQKPVPLKEKPVETVLIAAVKV